MYFIYTDETGKSFSLDKHCEKYNHKLFTDGIFFIYGGLAINFSKYEVIEEAFKDICKSILKKDNIYEEEIHAGRLFKEEREESILQFFEEIIMLLSKFNINCITGIAFKKANIFGNIFSENIEEAKNSKLKLQASAIYAFFNSIDYFLSRNNSKGIIISDEISDTRNFKKLSFLSENKNITGRKEPKLDLLILRIFFEKLKRFNEEDIEPILNFKHSFESKIYSVLDNIHFVKSNLSPFIQISDIVLFLINLYTEYVYLYEIKKEISKDCSNYDFYIKKSNLIKKLYTPLETYLTENQKISFVYYRENFYQISNENLYSYSLPQKSLKVNMKTVLKRIIEEQNKKHDVGHMT